MHNGSQFWAGSEQALAAFLSAPQPDAAAIQAYQSTQASDTPDTPRLFSQSGAVGVITIAGPLVNNDSWMNRYMGRTSYGEIRDALVHAAQDPTVGTILLDINSGGGSVSGVSDTAALIKKVDKTMKPVHTFSDGQIASAAYWLGSSARSVSVGQVTEAGSIGVITVHQEYSKQMEMSGVKASVLKAGDRKGDGNPYEVLSPKARAGIQAQLDHMYQLFTQTVADNRKVSYAIADTQMANGQVFIGEQAVAAGLADKVTNFDALVAKLTQGIDSQKKTPQYGANFPKGPVVRTAFTEQNIAAMAEAGTLLVAPVAATASIATAETDAALAAAAAAKSDEALTAAVDQINAAGPAIAEAVGAAYAVAAAAAEASKAEVVSELVAFLKTSLAESQAALLDATVQVRDMKAASESMAASHNALRQIAVASVDRLKVALAQPAGGADALADDTLLAEHASLRAQFESKFKAGGVAAVSSSGSSDEKSLEAVDPVRQARLASTRFAK